MLMPTTVLQDNKCGSAGCSSCNEGGAKLLVAGAASSTDPAMCITELCDDVGDNTTDPSTIRINPDRVAHRPVNLKLWR